MEVLRKNRNSGKLLVGLASASEIFKFVLTKNIFFKSKARASYQLEKS
jgi:hypothetical protein